MLQQLHPRVLFIGVIWLTSTLKTSSAILCKDDDIFEFIYEEKVVTCSDIGNVEYIRQMLCPIVDVATSCPKTCGHCCEDDPYFSFSTLHGPKVGCAYISRKPEKIEKRRNFYCNTYSHSTKVGDACPFTCDSCKELVPLDHLVPTDAPTPALPEEILPYIPQSRVGNWLPNNLEDMRYFLTTVADKAIENKKSGLVPLVKPIDDLKSLVNEDKALKQAVQNMFHEANKKRQKTVLNTTPIVDFDDFLHMLNLIMHTSPALYTLSQYDDTAAGVVACPINAILDFPMNTESGYVVFSNSLFNRQLKKILSYWSVYLMSEDSTYVFKATEEDPRNVLGATLIPWFSEVGLKNLTDQAFTWTHSKKAPRGKHFCDVFICIPSAENKGFLSWDEFFTRRFRPEIRPIGGPIPLWLDSDRVILNACESAPLNLTTNVQLEDKFWLKGQPYSITNILNFDEHAPQFEGGTIYQALLSALSYHRWNSPVSGTVVKTIVVDGSYYLQNLKEGFGNPDGPDVAAPNNSQKFLSAVATRGIIFIEADGPIGLMAFVAIGMSEVSSIDIRVEAGQRVEKGEELGMFHFGGSTHVILFRKDVNIDFSPVQSNHYNTGDIGVNATNIPVRAQIARVKDDSPAFDPDKSSRRLTATHLDL